MTSKIERLGDGRVEMTNLFPKDDGTIVRREAFGNAVITQLFYTGDDEDTGEPLYQEVTSLMVRDPEMEAPLRDLADRLINRSR